ncbi:hypothetical protein AB0F88_31530 [Streptosporangium sp. NPDC023963]|uniref:hypothetical protein n=1 Tax=Streptosporangium sp. NPDC023963 TaxID=3155608 RepID=UPI00343462E2
MPPPTRRAQTLEENAEVELRVPGVIAAGADRVLDAAEQAADIVLPQGDEARLWLYGSPR